MASITWATVGNVPNIIVARTVDLSSENYIIYMHICSFIDQVISSGIVLAIAALMLAASKHMAHPTHRTLLRVGSVISIVAVAMHLLYLLVQTVWSARSEYVIDEGFYDIALFFANTHAFAAMIALLSSTSKLLCAGCFLTHPHKGVRTLAIATLASGCLPVLLKFLPYSVNILITGTVFVLTLVAGTIAAVFYFMISQSYRDNKGADEA